jgi:hypothetical protein
MIDGGKETEDQRYRAARNMERNIREIHKGEIYRREREGRKIRERKRL